MKRRDFLKTGSMLAGGLVGLSGMDQHLINQILTPQSRDAFKLLNSFGHWTPQASRPRLLGEAYAAAPNETAVVVIKVLNMMHTRKHKVN